MGVARSSALVNRRGRYGATLSNFGLVWQARSSPEAALGVAALLSLLPLILVVRHA